MHLNIGLDLPPINEDTLETTVQDILRTYNASMWLAGDTEAADNYIDSLGAAPITQPNQIVGYVGDGTAQEEAENICINSEMVGADGVTPPTGWTGWTTVSGITMAYVGTGVDEFGRYIDVRFSGTATVNTFPNVAMAPNLTTPVVEGEVGSMAIPHQIVAGSLAGAGLTTARLQCLTSGGAYVNEAVGAQPTTDRALCALGRVVPATTAYIRPTYQVNALLGNAIDFTVRLWAPRAMRGNLGNYYPTTGTQVFRTRQYTPLNQATTGFKPTLNGGVFNYCARSHDFPLWTPTRLALIGSNLYGGDVGRSAIYQETDSASLQHFVQSVTILLPQNTIVHYSLLVKIISGPSNSVRLQNRKNDGATFPLANFDLDNGNTGVANGCISASIEDGPYGFKKLTIVWDTGAGASIGVPYVMTDRGNNNTGAARNTIEVARAFVGLGTSYSGPVPVVAATAQSADIVPYSWRFDGVDDRLELSKPFLNPAADHFIVAAFKMPDTVISAARVVVGFGNAGVNERAQIVFVSSNVVNAFWRDTPGTTQVLLSSTTALPVNGRACVSMRRKGANYEATLRREDLAKTDVSVAITTAAWVPGAGNIGCGVSGNADVFFFNGEIYGVVIGNGTPTASEITALEDYLIGCAGFTPVP